MSRMEYRESKSYPHLFLVGEDGSVMSKRRKGKLLKQNKHPHGYMHIATYDGGRKGKAICAKVHRLVAECFCENPENKPIVHHKDNNKSNNHFSNLEWTTYKENTQRAVDDGLLVSKRGADNKGAKLTEANVRWIRDHYKPYSTEFGTRALGKMFGVNHVTISAAIRGESWSHI